MWKLFKEVMYQSLTSHAGNYDPARVFGYIFVLMCCMTFLVFFIYESIKTGSFDSTKFFGGVAACCTALGSAAAGVWIKNGSETASK